jgi:hypothetical protein
MTTATINNKRVSLTVYAKAALLSVFEVPGQEGYIVSSGSDAHKAYHVSADGNACRCDSRVLCSHRIAVRRYKEEQNTPLRSEVCGHLVKMNIHRHCGCMA